VGHIRWGLERISRILEDLGDPHLAYDSLHIGGTNGKGSVCAIAGAIAGAERSVGLYTSPHLSSFAERIRIDGADAESELLERCAARVGPLAEREGATYFEAATALAFLAFAEAGIELAIAEVGLGGRLDATNVLRPEGCAIVSVGLDHCEYLGHSLGEVAAEKAGILKRGVPAVLGELPAEALRVVEAKAHEVGAPLYRLGRTSRLADVRVHSTGTEFTYRSPARPDGVALEVPLPGAHQAHNAAVALLLLERVGRLPPSRLPDLMARVRWPGRVEMLEDQWITWILDVAHNPAGASVLAVTLEALKPRRPLVMLTAMLARKAWSGILDILREPADAMVLTIADSHPEGAGWDLTEVQAYLERPEVRSGREGRPLVVEFSAELATAMSRASELAEGGTVVVAGSCYLVGDVRDALEAEGVVDLGRAV
jgi:dihydrofolate synthase/folylpolyglutamate synthase